MAMEAIKGAGMTYQGSVSSAESQPKTDSAVKAAETDAPEKGIVSENIKQAGEENVNTSQGADQRNTNAQIKKAVDEVNKKAVNSEAIFGIHEATNRVTITQRDPTGENTGYDCKSVGTCRPYGG